MNECPYYPHFTDEKTEAQRGEITLGASDGWWVGGKDCELRPRGSSLASRPLYNAARCLRKNLKAIKESAMQISVGEAFPGKGVASAKALRQEQAPGFQSQLCCLFAV